MDNANGLNIGMLEIKDLESVAFIAVAGKKGTGNQCKLLSEQHANQLYVGATISGLDGDELHYTSEQHAK